MKLLIDTDLLIGLEDDGPVRASFATLVRKSSENGLDILVHEASVEHLERDVDDERRRVRLSRARKFMPLEGVPTPTATEMARLYGRCDDEVDLLAARLLHALAVNAVDLLVSEDPGVHVRAKTAGLDARVLNVDEAISWIERTYEARPVFLPQVEDVLAYQLDYSDKIFDELRADYHPGFDDWVAKISRDHRPCWIVRDGAHLACLVIRKDEAHHEAQTTHPGPKILKVSTFKVAKEHRGRKLGEQLLKQILWYAQSNEYDLVYLTAYPKQASLLMLLETYGFVRASTAPDGELFMEKSIVKGVLAKREGETALTATMRTYPRFVAEGSVGKYVVPIRPAYHELLFPEFQGNADGASIGRPGNTIEKVYLCRAKTKSMKPGDVILFYMSQGTGTYGSQTMTTVGVVKSVRWSADLDEVKRWTAKRSVFSDDDLRELIEGGEGPLLIIDFLLIGHLTDPVTLHTLTESGVLTSWPQSIVRLDEERFARLRGLTAVGFET